MFRKRAAVAKPEQLNIPNDHPMEPVTASEKPEEPSAPPQNRYANGTVVQGSNTSYRLDKTIGKGSYGKVKLATDLSSGERFALKFISRESIRKPTHWIRINRETTILDLLHHPHIVKLYERIEGEHDICLVMEWISGADLFERIVRHREQRFSEREAVPLFRQLVSALDYCHANRVIHRDLKPENLMVDNRGNLKLIDFGFSNLYHPRSHLETNCGSPLYASPEIVQGVRYVGPEVDTWSSGVILFAMLTGTLPFEDEQLKGLYGKICAGNYTIPSFVSPAARDLIQSMLTVDPRSRATIQHIKYHPWVIGEAMYPPENFLPLRSMTPAANTAKGIKEDLIARMVGQFNFVDVVTTRHMILTQPYSPAYAIYCLLEEKQRRVELQMRKMANLPVTGSNVRKIYAPPPTIRQYANYRTESNNSHSDWLSVEPANSNLQRSLNDHQMHEDHLTSNLSCQQHSAPATPVKAARLADISVVSPSQSTGNSSPSGGIVAQAAAHVANRIRRLRELKFGNNNVGSALTSVPNEEQQQRPRYYHCQQGASSIGNEENNRQIHPTVTAAVADLSLGR